jgi:hypothetical protein
VNQPVLELLNLALDTVTVFDPALHGEERRTYAKAAEKYQFLQDSETVVGTAAAGDHSMSIG